MVNGWVKFTGITSVPFSELSFPFERIGRIGVVNTTTVYIYFDEPAYNNRATVSGYIKLTTAANKSDEVHTALIDLISTATVTSTAGILPVLGDTISQMRTITIDPFMADVTTIEWVPAI